MKTVSVEKSQKAIKILWRFLIGGLVITILAWFGYAITANTVEVGEQFLMAACGVVGSFGLLLDGTLVYMIGFETGMKKSNEQAVIDA